MLELERPALERKSCHQSSYNIHLMLNWTMTFQLIHFTKHTGNLVFRKKTNSFQLLLFMGIIYLFICHCLEGKLVVE